MGSCGDAPIPIDKATKGDDEIVWVEGNESGSPIPIIILSVAAIDVMLSSKMMVILKRFYRYLRLSIKNPFELASYCTI